MTFKQGKSWGGLGGEGRGREGGREAGFIWRNLSLLTIFVLSHGQEGRFGDFTQNSFSNTSFHSVTIHQNFWQSPLKRSMSLIKPFLYICDWPFELDHRTERPLPLK